MRTSETLDQIAGALVMAQGGIDNVTKASANPFFKSKYADLAAIMDEIKPALTAAGLAVVQGASSDDGRKVVVTTRILHISGQWIEDDLTMIAADEKPQTIGSCITYARRYALAAMCGVAQEDDDGNKASGRDGGYKAPAPGKDAHVPPAKAAEKPENQTPVGESHETRQSLVQAIVDLLQSHPMATDDDKAIFKSQAPKITDLVALRAYLDELKATLSERQYKGELTA